MWATTTATRFGKGLTHEPRRVKMQKKDTIYCSQRVPCDTLHLCEDVPAVHGVFFFLKAHLKNKVRLWYQIPGSRVWKVGGRHKCCNNDCSLNLVTQIRDPDQSDPINTSTLVRIVAITYVWWQVPVNLHVSINVNAGGMWRFFVRLDLPRTYHPYVHFLSLFVYEVDSSFGVLLLYTIRILQSFRWTERTNEVEWVTLEELYLASVPLDFGSTSIYLSNSWSAKPSAPLHRRPPLAEVGKAVKPG